ncbi:MAG: FAD-binding dehydrogenase [Spirochaetes bacterium]|nr:FAD-binding dehydrogenase [Spirochaetota bacterium]
MKSRTAYLADVAIIGGGIAGIVTALELLDKNLTVAVLDRDGPDKFGGQAITAFGGMALVGTPLQKLTGIQDSPELAFADWCDTAEFTENDELPRQWAEMYCHRNLGDVYRWIRKRGVHFLPSVLWPERGAYRPGNSVPRYHIMWGTGYYLMNQLIEELRGHPRAGKASLYFWHRVTSIDRSRGVIAGCSGLDIASGKEFTVKAGVVVVASGGIGGNVKRVKRIWPPELGRAPAELLIGSHPFCDGSSYDMAARAGGTVTNISSMWNYPEGVPHPSPQYPMQGLRVLAPKSALWMDYTGRRIGPEPLIGYFDTPHVAKIICNMKKQHTWHIMNWKIAVKELALSGAEHNEMIRDRKIFGLAKTVLRGNGPLVERMIRESEDFIAADSLPELVEKMNALAGNRDVSLAAMERDIRRYDDQIERGVAFHNDDQLRRIAHARNWKGDKMRTCKFQKIIDARAMPLIAIRYRMLTRKSLGGIQTDLQSRAVDKKGNPVTGLYAVGEAAGFGGGGINGKSSLEGTFISCCILTGRIAGRSIAGESNP